MAADKQKEFEKILKQQQKNVRNTESSKAKQKELNKKTKAKISVSHRKRNASLATILTIAGLGGGLGLGLGFGLHQSQTAKIPPTPGGLIPNNPINNGNLIPPNTNYPPYDPSGNPPAKIPNDVNTVPNGSNNWPSSTTNPDLKYNVAEMEGFYGVGINQQIQKLYLSFKLKVLSSDLKKIILSSNQYGFKGEKIVPISSFQFQATDLPYEKEQLEPQTTWLSSLDKNADFVLFNVYVNDAHFLEQGKTYWFVFSLLRIHLNPEIFPTYVVNPEVKSSINPTDNPQAYESRVLKADYGNSEITPEVTDDENNRYNTKFKNSVILKAKKVFLGKETGDTVFSDDEFKDTKKVFENQGLVSDFIGDGVFLQSAVDLSISDNKNEITITLKPYKLHTGHHLSYSGNSVERILTQTFQFSGSAASERGIFGKRLDCFGAGASADSPYTGYGGAWGSSINSNFDIKKINIYFNEKLWKELGGMPQDLKIFSPGWDTFDFGNGTAKSEKTPSFMKLSQMIAQNHSEYDSKGRNYPENYTQTEALKDNGIAFNPDDSILSGSVFIKFN